MGCRKRWAAGIVSLPCGRTNTRGCEHWEPGYLVLHVREVGLVLPIPCGIPAGGAWGHLDWSMLAFPLAGSVCVGCT